MNIECHTKWNANQINDDPSKNNQTYSSDLLFDSNISFGDKWLIYELILFSMSVKFAYRICDIPYL